MKELQERRNELDEQIHDKVDTIEALREAIIHIKKNPMISQSTIKLFETHKAKFEVRLEDSRRDWDMINGACIELERKNKVVQ